ncbi:hypothetical protein VIGAN_01207600 [Vigna angularis var. angularis]|uniref:Uncharacterized protein n=1 Tax=Vigna angularis var. angularis TaxID=157739 RepID=A0A0S3R1F3_PHAAN|nr:hypothetical protein VIGAN_01207600 [Vigna angularis var. angularis]
MRQKYREAKNTGNLAFSDLACAGFLVTKEGDFLELMDQPLLDSTIVPGEPGGVYNVGILKQGVVQGVEQIEVGFEHSIFPKKHTFLVELVASAVPKGRVF